MEYLMLSVVFAVIQISLWHSLPKWAVRLVFKLPFLAVIANILASVVIMKVAGTSAFIGMCNLTGSVMFGAYIYMYNELTKKGRSYETSPSV